MQEREYLVLFFDIFEYLTPATPVQVSDFLMAVTGGFSDALERLDLLPKERFKSYWERLSTFLQSEVEIQELQGKFGVLNIKASLRSDETFRRRLQQATAGNLAALVKDVCEYITETLEAIPRDARREGVVLIVDSIEKFSGALALTQAGTGTTDEIQASIARLFTAHATQLRLPDLHVVYTVPPWLSILSPNIGSSYSAGLHVLRPVKVRERGDERTPVPAALEAMHRLIEAREPEWERLLGGREQLDRLSLASGGHIRDLLRLITETITRAETLPVEAREIERAMTQVRGEFILADNEASWLAKIARTGNCLPDIGYLPRLATFLDSHLVLNYANGAGWWDVHPLVRDDVLKYAASE